MTARKALDLIFNGPWPLTFAMMGLFGALFGLTTANLLVTAHANIEFVLENGAWGLMEGGALQMLQLVALGYVSLAVYVAFKGCLYGLLGRFQKH
ncbi:hypothetical protein IHQ68_04180 [Chelatococcus sambhunathii]|uniref:Uncharacterized protein n=1 Tax=Chelatococcus sambhunathii TaxID=363953 RepID=A0ABU1DCJ7_9HYPH|nr:hypothetical protein [Chelatococcus sambhunathii]MDR4305823.1 hypothetical protein [Chelatococcus sambhunathii]